MKLPLPNETQKLPKRRGPFITGILIVMIGLIIMVATAHGAPSDNYDGDCTDQGSCADKCPSDTNEGTYFIRGYDDNGAAICAFSYFNACPYVENYPATDPMCEKARQDQVRAGVLPAPAPETVAPEQLEAVEFEGK